MHSMTGYGKGVSKRDGKTITIEIKTVNHRFLDCNFKLPRNFLFVEDTVKKAVSTAISRGHVDLYLTYEQSSTDEGAYTVDLELANNYLAAVRKLADGTGLVNDVTVSTLLRVGDIVTRQEAVEDEDLLCEMTLEAVNLALDNLISMREKEGQKMKEDILGRLSTIENMVCFIEKNAPLMTENYRNRLYNRLMDILEDKNIDEQRILTEAAIYSEKVAVDEETVRLHSHISQFRELLESDSQVGRKLDFLVQEMNREVNTTGSKAQDLDITRTVVEMKSEIEKIREQIQNIE